MDRAGVVLRSGGGQPWCPSGLFGLCSMGSSKHVSFRLRLIYVLHVHLRKNKIAAQTSYTAKSQQLLVWILSCRRAVCQAAKVVQRHRAEVGTGAWYRWGFRPIPEMWPVIRKGKSFPSYHWLVELCSSRFYNSYRG